jgi:hypothetical protein
MEIGVFCLRRRRRVLTTRSELSPGAEIEGGNSSESLAYDIMDNKRRI